MKKKGSLLIIFLFTTGLLAILVTGLYFTTTSSMVEQSFVEDIAAKKKVERALEQIHKSEMERLVKDYISNNLTQTLVAGFDASDYQSALASATNWSLKSDTLVEAGNANPGSLVLSFPDTVSYPTLAKSNPVATNTGFGQHPLSFALATDMYASLVANYTPTWSQKTFPYTRYFDCYREVPTVMLPLSAAYNVGALSKLDSITVAGGPVAFFGGDTNHTNAVVATSVSTLFSTPTNYPNLPQMISTYGEAAEKIAEYDGTGTGAALRQEYSLDLNAIVLSFDGSNINVQSAPNGSTTVPSAITTVTFDNQTRLQIDLSTLPTTGNYAYCKWYINCTTNAAKAAGIVLKDTGSGTGAAANASIATNGMLYLWTYNRTGKTGVVAATSYGAVGLADSVGYSSGTSSTAALSFAFNGLVSAYTRASTSSLTTPAVSGSPWQWNLSGSALNAAYAGALMAYDVTASGIGSVHLILTNSSTYPITGDKMDLSVSESGSSATPNYTSSIGGAGENVSGSTFGTPIGSAIYRFVYSPATNEVFILIINNGSTTLVFKKKLNSSYIPSWLPSTVDMTYTGLTATSVAATVNPIGTYISSPQTSSGLGSASIYGGMAIGEGIASSLYTASTLNFSYKSAVGVGLENLCERILVHYPYFYKP